MLRLGAARFRRVGIVVPRATFGLRHSGAMTVDRLHAAIAALPAGLSEIYLHPAVRDDYPGHGPGYRHRDELAALPDPGARQQSVAHHVQIGNFAALI